VLEQKFPTNDVSPQDRVLGASRAKAKRYSGREVDGQVQWTLALASAVFRTESTTTITLFVRFAAVLPALIAQLSQTLPCLPIFGAAMIRLGSRPHQHLGASQGYAGHRWLCSRVARLCAKSPSAASVPQAPRAQKCRRPSFFSHPSFQAFVSTHTLVCTASSSLVFRNKGKNEVEGARKKNLTRITRYRRKTCIAACAQTLASALQHLSYTG